MNTKMNQLLPCVGVTALIVLLAGCGALERTVATATGFSRMCVDGVEYLQFTSGVTVAWSKDGKIKLCS